jgi:hypothetical protein
MALSQIFGNQEDPAFLSQFRNPGLKERLGTCRPTRDHFLQERLDLIPCHCAHHPQDQVLWTDYAGMDSAQGLGVESHGCEIRLFHIPPDGMVAKHDPIELGDGKETRRISPSPDALELARAPDLHFVGIKPGVSQDVRPEIHSRFQMLGQCIHTAERALPTATETQVEGIKIHKVINRVGGEFSGPAGANQAREGEGRRIGLPGQEGIASFEPGVKGHQRKGMVFHQEYG